MNFDTCISITYRVSHSSAILESGVGVEGVEQFRGKHLGVLVDGQFEEVHAGARRRQTVCPRDQLNCERRQQILPPRRQNPISKRLSSGLGGGGGNWPVGAFPPYREPMPNHCLTARVVALMWNHVTADLLERSSGSLRKIGPPYFAQVPEIPPCITVPIKRASWLVFDRFTATWAWYKMNQVFSFKLGSLLTSPPPAPF